MSMKLRVFSLERYVQEALKNAEYSRDENGVVVGRVPNASGSFAQGDNFEEARENLREVIEGNVLLALQLGLDIPRVRVSTSRNAASRAPPRGMAILFQGHDHKRANRATMNAGRYVKEFLI